MYLLRLLWCLLSNLFFYFFYIFIVLKVSDFVYSKWNPFNVYKSMLLQTFNRKCVLLEVARFCKYRFRLGSKQPYTWYYISQLARNRVSPPLSLWKRILQWVLLRILLNCGDLLLKTGLRSLYVKWPTPTPKILNFPTRTPLICIEYRIISNKL